MRFEDMDFMAQWETALSYSLDLSERQQCLHNMLEVIHQREDFEMKIKELAQNVSA